MRQGAALSAISVVVMIVVPGRDGEGIWDTGAGIILRPQVRARNPGGSGPAVGRSPWW